MRATGIARTIDSLGRIVIPKEIRKTMRIREADLLEFYVGNEGELVLRKYSPMGEMTGFARQYAESLFQVSGLVSIITDREQIIAVAGGYKEMLSKPISTKLQQAMEQRQVVLAKEGEITFIPILQEQCEAKQQAIAPILSNGDVVGSVIFLTKDSKERMGEIEKKLLQSAATFLGRQMELN